MSCFIDTRRQNCFANVIAGQCDSLVGIGISKSECCNSGQGKAWGLDCELCPTDEVTTPNKCQKGFRQEGTQCVGKSFCLFLFSLLSLLTQGAIWTLIQRFLNVINVRLTSKEQCMLTCLIQKAQRPI